MSGIWDAHYWLFTGKDWETTQKLREQRQENHMATNEDKDLLSDPSPTFWEALKFIIWMCCAALCCVSTYILCFKLLTYFKVI